MDSTLENSSRRLFQFAFLSLALFVPFSIAGSNIAVGVGALAWVFYAISRHDRLYDRVGRRGDLDPRNDPFMVASLALVLLAVPSVIMSEDFVRALGDWRSYWLLFIHFLVASNVARVHTRQGVFWVLFVSATVSCLVAFVQRAGGVDAGWFQIGPEHRVGSTLYTMTFAGILYQLVVFNVAVALGSRTGLGARLVIGAGAAVQFAALLLTMTRGAWLAAVAGLVAACVMIRNRGVALVAALLLVAMAIFSFGYGRDEGRAISITALFNSAADRNVSTRLVLWDIAWDLFKEHPVAGVGMGDYTREANKLVGEREVQTTVDSHNVYLQILSTRGLIGFIPFAIFWVVLFRELFRAKNARERGSIEWSYSVGAIAVTVAVLFGALTELNIDDEEVFIALMVLTGLARSAVYTPRSPHRPHEGD